MARRIIKRRKTQKRRRTRQRGGGCDPYKRDCTTCPGEDTKFLCQQMADRVSMGTRSHTGGKSRRRIKRKGTKRRKP